MASFFPEILADVDKLTDEEKAQLMAKLTAQLSGCETVRDAKKENEDIIPKACPRCGTYNEENKVIKKHGKVNGKQRYKCKSCNKTFCESTSYITHHSHLSEWQWQEIIRGMILGLSIPKIADLTELSVKAVWFNRNKVLHVLANLFGYQDRFVDIAECDEHFVHMSFKGKRDPAFFVKVLGRLPRHNRTRKEKIEYLEKYGLWDELSKNPEQLELLLRGDADLPGTNRDSVCILTGKDRSGNLFAKPVCLGNAESSHIVSHFDGRFNEDTILVTDGNNSYNWFAEERNIYHVKVPSDKKAVGPYSLAHVNSVHKEMTDMWPKDWQNLPATKYLDLNMMLFWWLEKNKDISINEKVERLWGYVKESEKLTLTYDQLVRRELQLDTKGLIPTRV